MRKILLNLKGDKVIWAVVLILSLISILAVYSATGSLAYREKVNPEFYLLKQIFILIMGLVLMYFAHLIKYTHYSKISQIALLISIVLLLVTLFRGETENEATRRLILPIINIKFQPSDFAKLALIMYLARLLSNRQEDIKDYKKGFLPIVIPIAVIFMLILPDNLSTAAILFATSLILIFVGRVKTQYILSLLGVMAVLCGIFFLVAKNSPNQGRLRTWGSRMENFLGSGTPDPKDEFQNNQAKIAIANGAPFGKFPGNSTQRNILPQAYSDFIFAIIIEEYGILGAIVIILLYLILLYRGIRIASRCDKFFGTLLGLGISFVIVFQAMINMGVTLDLLPNTGQTLPLVSLGGTSIWLTSIGIGILLSISRANDEAEKLKAEQEANNELKTEITDAVTA